MRNVKHTISVFVFILLCSFVLVKPVLSEIAESDIEILFSPGDECAKRIIYEVHKAKHNIIVAMYYFTSRPIAQSLIDASEKGVKVRICLDGSDPHYEHSKGVYLQNKSIPVKVINGKGIMHNKFCVIDDRIVITGSFNWTARADLENDENLLVIRSGEVAEKYKEEFEKLWDGKKIDAFYYQDKTRVEKIPLPEFIAVTSILKTSGSSYIGHKGTKKLHLQRCNWAGKIKTENKVAFSTKQEAIDKGYVPCKVCKP